MLKLLVLTSVLLAIVCEASQHRREPYVHRDDAYKSYDEQQTQNVEQKLIGDLDESGAPLTNKLRLKYKKIKMAGIRVPQPHETVSLNNFAYRSLWRDFKDTHNKSYDTQDEEHRRFHIFAENLRKVEEHNEGFRTGRHTYELGMNKFGDMTNEEFRATYNGFKRSLMDENARDGRATTFLVPNNVVVPKSVDWREKGYVTPVKNQGQCGSCWAFSAVGALEGQHFRKTGRLTSLSEQNLVDCSRNYGNNGCSGGLMDYAFKYVQDNNGVDTEDSYPYEAVDGRCRFNNDSIGADDTGFSDIPQDDETALTAALASVGPVSVAIDASRTSFQLYKSGVYHDPECNPSNIDHGVLAVGYGVSDDGQKYYIIKNSWGPEWGNEGYIFMLRNGKNTCGIARAASYPLV